MPRCGGHASAIDRVGPEAEKAQLTTAVRYGKMGLIGEFAQPPSLSFTCGGMLVISTDRGLEIGQHVRLTCPGCDQAIAREKMLAYAQASNGEETYRLRTGRILREATEADLAELRHIESTAGQKLEIAQKMAGDFGLDMKFVDCEQIFGGERVIFYFMSEQRVDFRQLVRQLASEFQTRIEMRQVGARDEARLLADFETCGRECCCKNFLKELKPITMAMAKLQKTTLDLAKVSGRCARLKCCLRYEHESYEALNKKLPRNNSWIRTAAGVGKVIDRQVLTQLVRVRTEEDRIVIVPVEEILETNLPPPSPRPTADDRSNGGGSRRERREPARRATARPRAVPEPQDNQVEQKGDIAGGTGNQAQVDESGSGDPAPDGLPGTTGNDASASPADQDRSPENQRQRRRNRRGRRSRRRGQKNRPGQDPAGGEGGQQ